MSKNKVVLRRREPPPQTKRPRPCHVIRIPKDYPRGLRESLINRACIEIDRGKWPVEHYSGPIRDI
jgi:hypothetical protein